MSQPHVCQGLKQKPSVNWEIGMLEVIHGGLLLKVDQEEPAEETKLQLLGRNGVKERDLCGSPTHPHLDGLTEEEMPCLRLFS